MDKPKLVRITTIPLSLFSLLKGQLKFMKNYFEVQAVTSNGELIDSVRENEQVPVHTIEMTRKISPLKDINALWKMYKYLKKEKPLIVHTHTPKAGIVGMLAGKIAGVPYRFHTVAGLPLLEVTGKTRILLNAVEKLTYSCATHVYPNSFVLREILIKQGFAKEEKLKVIANGSSNGIDTSYFDISNISEQRINDLKKELNISPEDFVFVFVGRLVGDKGLNEMVAAFERIQNLKNVKLLLVGPFESDLDPLKNETLKAIEENKDIICVGFQKDVRPYFAISDVLVFPSYREGFPNVVMQAGAMGLPVIASDINGCNEIIVEKENGLIIPVKDENAVYTAMVKLLEDKDLFNKLKSNARKMIVDRYEQKLVWQAILEEYKKVTGLHLE